MKPVKPKKCKICKTQFMPFTTTAVVCGFRCAEHYAKQSRERKEASLKRAERVKTKKSIQDAQPKSYWLKKAQFQFNKYIRIRDANHPCISCNRWHTGQYHAGHYRSVGSAPHLRFNELNCHRQCSVCNNHLSGNQINYRKELINKIGLGAVEALEANQEAKHYTIDDIKEITEIYKQKIKELENENHS
ncbi:MAG TPA: recombination protein NinG [Psychromonas sp.]